ncbi:MAG TPA: DUF445 domain-containing protein [Allosphingosinicella sp.]|nr:DUF445 domain-containing protein [Allosphingosinicella sp.]
MTPLLRDRSLPDPGRRMRVLATAMLAGMAVVFIAAANLDDDPTGFWSFVKAFAEAAMVGGIADWFAVTALFRHPLGLPIPHTAIIPKNKDRIGGALASFLRTNFLVPSVVARRMRRIDVAAAAGRFLANPPEGGRVREGASRLLADVLEALDEDRLGGMVKGAVANRLRGTEVAPLLGRTLAATISDDRHIPLLDNLVAWAGRALDANEDLIRQMVHDKANWILKLAGLDTRLADAIVDGLRKLSFDMVLDPDHPVRQKAEEALVSLAWSLQNDPATQAKVESWKQEMIENQAVTDWLGGLWEQSRSALLKAARDPEAMLAGKFGEAIRQLGETLQTDPRLAAAINQFARRAAAGTASAYGDQIVTLVSDTVRSWDATTVSTRLEAAVGKDLQYIRINGTVVGGLVGLLIHTLEVVL